MSAMVHPVILSGGAGTRLWPLSRALRPKQLLPLVTERSMLQETLLRVGGGGFAMPLVICNEEHRFLIAEQARELKMALRAIVLEPEVRNTAPAATSPWAVPGNYTVTLTAGGETFSQPLTVAMDPRVKASAADLQEQFDLSWRLYQLRLKLAPMGEKFDDIAEQLTKLKARAAERPDVTQKLEAFAQTLMKFGPPHPRPGASPSFFVLDSTKQLFNEIEVADAAPTAATKAAVADLEAKAGPMIDAWRKLLESDLPALNQQLKQAGFQEIKTESEQANR